MEGGEVHGRAGRPLVVLGAPGAVGPAPPRPRAPRPPAYGPGPWAPLQLRWSRTTVAGPPRERPEQPTAAHVSGAAPVRAGPLLALSPHSRRSRFPTSQGLLLRGPPPRQIWDSQIKGALIRIRSFKNKTRILRKRDELSCRGDAIEPRVEWGPSVLGMGWGRGRQRQSLGDPEMGRKESERHRPRLLN